MKSFYYFSLGVLINAVGYLAAASLDSLFTIFIFIVAPISIFAGAFFYELSLLSLLKDRVKISIVTKVFLYIFFLLFSVAISSVFSSVLEFGL